MRQEITGKKKEGGGWQDGNHYSPKCHAGMQILVSQKNIATQ